MVSIVLYLEGGKTLIAVCSEEEYETMLDVWIQDKGLMDFDNCSVRSEKVMAIEYI